jgi:hypothetical protein
MAGQGVIECEDRATQEAARVSHLLAPLGELDQVGHGGGAVAHAEVHVQVDERDEAAALDLAAARRIDVVADEAALRVEDRRHDPAAAARGGDLQAGGGLIASASRAPADGAGGRDPRHAVAGAREQRPPAGADGPIPLPLLDDHRASAHGHSHPSRGTRRRARRRSLLPHNHPLSAGITPESIQGRSSVQRALAADAAALRVLRADPDGRRGRARECSFARRPLLEGYCAAVPP